DDSTFPFGTLSVPCAGTPWLFGRRAISSADTSKQLLRKRLILRRSVPAVDGVSSQWKTSHRSRPHSHGRLCKQYVCLCPQNLTGTHLLATRPCGNDGHTSPPAELAVADGSLPLQLSGSP